MKRIFSRKYIVTLGILLQMVTLEGAPTKKHKANNKNYSSLWFDIKSRPERNNILSAAARDYHSGLEIKDDPSKLLSDKSMERMPNINKLFVPNASEILEGHTPPKSHGSNSYQRALFTRDSSEYQMAPVVSKTDSSFLRAEMDIESLLPLQVQSKKLDSILENLGTLSNKIPEMTSCKCECAGSPDGSTKVPVTLEHLKSNIERLRKGGTSDKNIIVAVFTAMYSGLQRRSHPNSTGTVNADTTQSPPDGKYASTLSLANGDKYNVAKSHTASSATHHTVPPNPPSPSAVIFSKPSHHSKTSSPQRTGGTPFTKQLLPPVQPDVALHQSIFPPVNHIEVMIESPTNRREYSTILSPSPNMGVYNAIYEASIKLDSRFAEKNPLDFRLEVSRDRDCYVVEISGTRRSSSHGWMVTVLDGNKKVIYEDTCIPTKKELPVLMGYIIKLGYRSVGNVNDNQSVVLS